MKEGICVAGSAIVDLLYEIECYPPEGELTLIGEDIRRSTGGLVCNVLMDLARLDPELPLTAFGRLGTDAEGDFVIESLSRFPNISTEHMIRDGRTSFTMVMTDMGTKQRTFFQYPGACAQLRAEDFDWDALDCRLVHIGYILLLRLLDQEDAQYGTKMARVLHDAKRHGILTSVDVVSETSVRMRQLLPPALSYTDYCVINEVEAESATGIALRAADGTLLMENLEHALKRLMEQGIGKWALVHYPEGGCGMDTCGNFVSAPSLALPAGYIRGSVGAGDAFCAGVLLKAYEGGSLEDALRLGIASAACSLAGEDASSAMKTVGEVEDLYRRYSL